MIFDYDEAQSLAQDVFLKVYESLKRYKSQDNFQAFVFTIAKNLTLNYIKKQKRFLWFSGNSSENSEEKHYRTEETQQQYIEKNQQEIMMTEALKTLKENQRIALIMKVYLDFSYKRIEEITGWSIPKIETLISRAKSSLIASIREAQAGPGHFHSTDKNKKKTEEKLQEKSSRGVLRMRST
jgi:RNA polymerase sigma-70 factor, ECF subfamily